MSYADANDSPPALDRARTPARQEDVRACSEGTASAHVPDDQALSLADALDRLGGREPRRTAPKGSTLGYWPAAQTGSLKDRLAQHCHAEGECIVYDGPATLRRGGGRGKTISPHRAAWLVATGELPQGYVQRTCSTEGCIRFEHLRVSRTKAPPHPNPNARPLDAEEARYARALFEGGWASKYEIAKELGTSTARVAEALGVLLTSASASNQLPVVPGRDATDPRSCPR